MIKLKYVLKKTQIAYIEFEADELMTVGERIDKIQEMSEDELEFSEPEYSLESILKSQGKITRFVYRKPS